MASDDNGNTIQYICIDRRGDRAATLHGVIDWKPMNVKGPSEANGMAHSERAVLSSNIRRDTIQLHP